MKLYYIRHGYPLYEPNCLTERGKYEARCVADYLKDLGIKKVIASDSNRAVETASYLTDIIKLQIIQYHSLNEDVASQYFATSEDGKFLWVFWSKKCMDLMKKHEGDKDLISSSDFKEYKICEGFKICSDEFDKILLSLNIIHDRKNKKYFANGDYPDNVAIFAHGGMGMAFVPSLLDESYCDFCLEHNHLDTAGIAIFDIDLENTHEIKLVEYNKIVYDPLKAGKLSIKNTLNKN